LNNRQQEWMAARKLERPFFFRSPPSARDQHAFANDEQENLVHHLRVHPFRRIGGV
jgi:hypothetical protein